MDENSRKYVCAICGKSYENLEDRIACETKCFNERKMIEAKQKEDKLKTKRINSEKEIEQKLAEVNEMIREHLNEYDSLKLSHTYYYLSYIFSKHPLWMF